MKKIVNDGYIVAIGDFQNGEEITQAEYAAIMSELESQPNEPGKYSMLTESLEWVLFDLPDVPEPEHDVTAEEILADLEAIL